MRKDNAVGITHAAFQTALIAVCAWITVPGTIPFTMQIFAVFCALYLLGGKWGTISVGTYLLLGAMGLPVFSGFQGGLGILFGYSGGFLLGFLVMSLIYWRVVGEQSYAPKRMLCGTTLGLLGCYALGLVWLVIIYSLKVEQIGIGTVFMMYCLPFLIPDLVKMGLAYGLYRLLQRFPEINVENRIRKA